MSAFSQRLYRGVVLVALILPAMACGDAERIAPVGGGGGGATAASSTGASTTAVTATSSGAGGEGAGTPIRTILQRDPFGNVGETHNLLWDGDFEWESPFADQYGWYQGQTGALTDRHVGPECHSGIKCAVLGPELIGLAVSSADHDLYASAWIRPTGGSCDDFSVFLLAEGIYDDAIDLPLQAGGAQADADGFCHFEAIAPQRDDKAYLYARSAAAEPAYFDDAVIREATEEEAQRVAPLAAWVPTAALARELGVARDTIRRWRGPHDGAPNPARDAAARWSRGEGRIRLKPSPRVYRGGGR